jgi:tetratricopeptide (TPR) repeat protein
MELVQGRTLEHDIREQGPLDAGKAAAIGVEVLRGLSALHHAGLVHRDVKAANVMRQDSGRIVLMDLGAGQLVVEASSGDLAGTPLYVAPELLEGTPATARSDVYSVGVLLYHLVTAAYPVRAATLWEVREAHRQKQRMPLRDARPDLPPRFVDVVERATAVAPTERFESAVEFETLLAASVTPGLGLLARVATRGRVVAAVAILGIAVGLGAFALAGGKSAQARLGFQPRDLVLVTRFENRTGETIFDGAIEYAIERELDNSDVVGLVPAERVDDALRFMKRPPGTVIDRSVGREVALRDGHIKALLTGRIERFGSSYVLSAQLVDPANDSVVATIGEEATGQQMVLAALRRQATRVRLALGEHRDQIKGADPKIEPAATTSLRAFQLYNEAYRLGRQNQWRAARELAYQLVEIDPNFASGWIWLAWSIKNTEFPNTGAPSDTQISRYREYIERALRLAERLPEWERHWVTGSYYTLLGEHAKAAPQYEALLRLRPDHYYAYNNLTWALSNLLRAEDARERIRLVRLLADLPRNDTPPASSSSCGRRSRSSWRMWVYVYPTDTSTDCESSPNPRIPSWRLTRGTGGTSRSRTTSTTQGSSSRRSSRPTESLDPSLHSGRAPHTWRAPFVP